MGCKHLVYYAMLKDSCIADSRGRYYILNDEKGR